MHSHAREPEQRLQVRSTVRTFRIEAWKGRMVIGGSSHEVVHNADLDLAATCVAEIIVKDLMVPVSSQNACNR